ncbi:MAG: ATPase [Archaeoglobus sp.]|nr:MAG: ATPase [Archaeoglobus sp.]
MKAKGAVGRIYGEATSTEFSFVVFDPREVRRTDYVKVWNDVEGWVIAQVLEIKATADLSGTDILEGKDAEKEMYIAKASVIGRRDDDGMLRTPKTPFAPGENVFKAEEDFIIDVLGLKKDGIYIGYLQDTNIKVKLDVNSLVQKHCCILAKTGSGKSYTAGVIVEELLEIGVPLFIIDPHGEYSSLKFPNDDEFDLERMKYFNVNPKGYENVVVYVPPNSPFAEVADGVLRLDGKNLSAEEIIELAGISGNSSQALVYQAVKNLKKRGVDYTVEDVICEVEGIKHNSKWTVLGCLEKIVEVGFFDGTPTPVSMLLQKDRAVVLDMRGTPPEHQDLMVSRICNELFELRKLGEVPPGMIVIEEAHNFIPERGFGRSISTQILRTIASEGRKFSLGLMVISQRPARIDKNVISQCNTQIILRVTNPNDINAIKKGVEGLTSETVDEIKRLPPGTAMVVSPELEKPVIVEIRVKRSKHGGVAVNVVDVKKEKIKKKGFRLSKNKKSEFEGKGIKVAVERKVLKAKSKSDVKLEQSNLVESEEFEEGKRTSKNKKSIFKKMFGV